MEFAEYLQKTGACREALAWVGEKDFETAWQECHRGDWMLWFVQKAELCDLRTLTLMKARCAELVRLHMRDERSIAALDAAFAYAEGKMEEGELAEYAVNAFTAAARADDADAAAADAAVAVADTADIVGAAYAARAAADAARAAAAAAAAADAADAAAAAARAAVLARCADICREVLPNPHFKF
jgi:delta 1-pyrroline-5-carboxylate dehydrogenase